MKQIILFASGDGTNAENIIHYFENNKRLSVVGIFTNNPKAGVIKRAEKLSMPLFLFSRPMLYENGEVLQKLLKINPDLIVLAGLLWKIPSAIIDAFPKKIINIHPALLPKFGGKGMFGMNVHKAVLAACEQESGITIHWVDNRYDHGSIISQFKCPISTDETPESLALKIHHLEYDHYPVVIEEIVKNR